MKHYLGFEYKDTPETKAGEPNPNTKRLSTAGELIIFQNPAARLLWINDACAVPGKRIIVSRNEARKLHCGLTDVQFAEKFLQLTGSQNT